MEPKSRSAHQIEDYLNTFIKKLKEKQAFATLKNADIKQSIYPNQDIIVILSESELSTFAGKTDIDTELSITINSDLYHNLSITHQLLRSVCKIISLKHTPIITVTDCPDRPRIEINITSESNKTRYADINKKLMKMLPDHLIGTDTTDEKAPIFAYLNKIENEKLTIGKYIKQNGNFSDELQWLIDFKEFVIEIDPESTAVMLEKDGYDQTYAIINYDYDGYGNTDEIRYPLPTPTNLCDTYFLESITNADLDVDDIKNLPVQIIRNDENIILNPHGRDYNSHTLL